MTVLLNVYLFDVGVRHHGNNRRERERERERETKGSENVCLNARNYIKKRFIVVFVCLLFCFYFKRKAKGEYSHSFLSVIKNILSVWRTPGVFTK